MTPNGAHAYVAVIDLKTLEVSAPGIGRYGVAWAEKAGRLPDSQTPRLPDSLLVLALLLLIGRQRAPPHM
jgi:hypothetical protein